MATWIKARRVFFASVGTILSIHFTLMYLFVREQLMAESRPPRSSSDFPFYFHDERSPLETDANTDWGMDFRDPKLPRRRRLESNSDGEIMERIPNPLTQNERPGLKQEPKAGDPSQDNSFKVGSRLNPNDTVIFNVGAAQTSCFGSRPVDEELEEPLQWQDVVAGSVYVFSAYLDLAPSGRGRLVVIGLADLGVVLEPHTYFCQVWYRYNGIKSKVVPATMTRLSKGYNHSRSDVFFHCPANPKKDPLAVSIVNRKSCARAPPNLLYIRNIDEAQARTRPVNNFTVCIPPLRNSYNDTKTLVETVELSFLLGASRVIFYDQDTTDSVKSFYTSYKNDDAATVIPWILPDPLPSSKGDPMSDFAVESALNDCLYRFRFTSKYLVFTDIGQVIVPEAVTDWNDLMLKLQPKPEISVLRFLRKSIANSARLTDNANPTAKRQFRLVSKAVSGRYKTQGLTSAYIVRPTDVEVVGVHDVIQKRRGDTLVVNVTDASLQDYYPQTGPGGVPVQGTNRLQAYSDALTRRVEKRLALIKGRP